MGSMAASSAESCLMAAPCQHVCVMAWIIDPSSSTHSRRRSISLHARNFRSILNFWYAPDRTKPYGEDATAIASAAPHDIDLCKLWWSLNWTWVTGCLLFLLCVPLLMNYRRAATATLLHTGSSSNMMPPCHCSFYLILFSYISTWKLYCC